VRRTDHEIAQGLVRLHGRWERTLEEYARSFTDQKRRELAKEDKALPDGSYPIETAADLGPAITLANSGHGDVAAAKALIKRRAKALGAGHRVAEVAAANGESETDAHDSSIMSAISDAVALQEKSPDLKTDSNDMQVLSHLHAARAAQQRDTDTHSARAGY
jgi:hypothetical protein